MPAVTGYTRMVAVGDFGSDADGGGHREAQAANIVKSLDNMLPLDAVLALGDTNYPAGAADTIDRNVGKYYGQFMWPLSSNYSRGSPDQINRFFPCPGNHDWGNRGGGSLDAYLDYMPVARRRIYDARVKNVHLFLLDSDGNENRFDGNSATSKQALWLKAALAASNATWKLVISHEPPFSSGLHGSSVHMQWPFEEWGATAVLSGHDHSFERITAQSGFPYFINGLGGAGLYGFRDSGVKGSVVRYDKSPGVQVIEADHSHMVFRFLAAPTTAGGRLNSSGLDCYEVERNTTTGIHSYRNCTGHKFKVIEEEPTETDDSGAASCVAEAQECSAVKACCPPHVCNLASRCGFPQQYWWMRLMRRHTR